MGFHYSFQQIVNLKVSERTQAEWYLVESLGRLRSEEHSLHELQQLKAELGDKMIHASSEAVSISYLNLLQEYSDYLDQQILQKQKDVLEAKQVVAKKQEVLSNKMMDEKVWNKARDKAYREYVAVMQKREQNMLDEIATTRYLRMS